MGKNRRHLSESQLKHETIFPDRMVAECDETIHLHWRNLRLEMSDSDFVNFAEMVLKSYAVYKMKGLKTNDGQHIELAKSKIESPIESTRFKVDEQVNLYKELNYPHAEFYEDDNFIVIRLRDLRIEMGIDEFKQIAKAIKEADEKLV